MKTIAIDIDDTLNNFSETMKMLKVPYEPASGVDEETFYQYVEMVKRNEYNEYLKSDLLNTKFTQLYYRMHTTVHKKASLKEGAADFLWWLKSKEYRIVICTYRDLRQDYTKEFFRLNHIPYDEQFITSQNIEFCKLWKISFLVDDDIHTILHGEEYGIHVFYPMMEKHKNLPKSKAEAFMNFDDLKQYL
jgi:uncharacterized HAD superfamily protein